MAALVGDSPFLLFLGRLNWKKGLDRLLAALALAGTARVVIAGGDDQGYRTALERVVADLGIQSRVTFVGPVEGDNKAALLGNARALVLPSYSENFGNVVLEAMAAGCPVIVTPEVGVADMVAASGVGLVAAGEPSALAASLSTLMADPGLARRMGAQGRVVAAAQFSWEAAAERMERCYQELGA
jgi:glycosyltransferase involved in cell wall biosynthesis